MIFMISVCLFFRLPVKLKERIAKERRRHVMYKILISDDVIAFEFVFPTFDGKAQMIFLNLNP
jgi:hypothetical protein